MCVWENMTVPRSHWGNLEGFFSLYEVRRDPILDCSQPPAPSFVGKTVASLRHFAVVTRGSNYDVNLRRMRYFGSYL